MKDKRDRVTWMQNKGAVVTLINQSERNFVFELATGRLRLDAGRRLRITAGVAAHPRIQALIDKGELAVTR